MLLDEADPPRRGTDEWRTATFALTNLASDLSLIGNDDINSQGNYDYDAHAQVHSGGADPLGSRGYASEVRHPLSSWTRPAKQNARGHFYFWEQIGIEHGL